MDNFSQFIQTYLEYVPLITSKVMLSRNEEIDEDLLDAGICWAVTDNMMALLEKSSRRSLDKSSNVSQIINFLQQELSQNALVIALQDPNYMDHWFALIGDHGSVHIVEHLPNKCNSFQTWNMENFLSYFSQIVVGLEPDRFYQNKSSHIFTFWSFNRKSLTRETVLSYISTDQHGAPFHSLE